MREQKLKIFPAESKIFWGLTGLAGFCGKNPLHNSPRTEPPDFILRASKIYFHSLSNYAGVSIMHYSLLQVSMKSGGAMISFIL